MIAYIKFHNNMIGISDYTFHRLAKDVVKALKKRLQHKNPHVHLLALTVLSPTISNVLITHFFCEITLNWILYIMYVFVLAFGDNGEKLWWSCACCNHWKECTTGYDQDCEEKGKFPILCPINLCFYGW